MANLTIPNDSSHRETTFSYITQIKRAAYFVGLVIISVSSRTTSLHIRAIFDQGVSVYLSGSIRKEYSFLGCNKYGRRILMMYICKVLDSFGDFYEFRKQEEVEDPEKVYPQRKDARFRNKRQHMADKFRDEIREGGGKGKIKKQSRKKSE